MENSRNKTIVASVSIIFIFGISLGNSYATALLARFGEFYPDVDPTLFPYFQSVSFIGALIGAVLVGALVPRFVGYKPMAIIGSLLFIIPGVLPVWIHDSFPLMCFMKCLVGIGAGCMSPLANGLATAILVGTTRQKVLSIGSAFAQVAAICMQMLAGVLGDIYFWYAFYAPVVGVISLVGAFMISEPPMTDFSAEKTERGKLDGKVWYCVVLEFVAAMALMPFLFNFSYFVAQVSDLITAATTVQACYSIGMALGGALYFVMFKAFKRRTVGVSMLFCVVGMICFVTLGKNLVLLALFNGLVGVGYGIFFPAMMDVVGITVKPRLVAFATSLLMISMNIASFAGAPFIQAVGTATGDPVLAPVIAGIAIFAVCAVVLLFASPYPKDISALLAKGQKAADSE